MAGFGKTTLLRQIQNYLSGRGCKVATLRLDAADNEKMKFVTYLVSAFGEALPSISRSMDVYVAAVPPLSVEEIIAALVVRLEAVQDQVFLFIDDYHTIARGEVHETFEYFLVNMPPNVHCLVGSRSCPPWAANRSLDDGWLQTIDEPALRFTRAEVAEYLSKHHDIQLEPAELGTFCAQTEGWITAIKLAAISVQNARPNHPVRDFSVDAKMGVFEYLAGTIFSDLDKETQDFLLQTAPLKRMCASLCDAVTGVRTSRRMLEKLRRENLFLSCLDTKGEWFQYNSLFGEFLADRLANHSDFSPEDIHRRASYWYEFNKQPCAAAEHALAAGNPERNEALIEAAILDLVRRSQIARAIGLYESLPHDFPISRPDIPIPMAWSYFFSRQYDQAARQIDRAWELLSNNSASQSQNDLVSIGRYTIEIEILRMEIGRVSTGRLPDPTRLSELKAQIKPDWFFLRSYVELLLTYVHIRHDRLEAALAAASECILHASKVPNIFVVNLATAQTAIIRQLQGRDNEAVTSCHQAISRAIDKVGLPLPIAGHLRQIEAQVHYERNELDRARDAIERAIQLTALCESPDLQSEIEILSALIMGAEDGESAAAVRLFRHSITELGRSDIYSVERVRAYLAWFMAGIGDTDGCAGLLRQMGMPIGRATPNFKAINPTGEIVLLACCRYFLATGNHDAAASWLRYMLKFADNSGRVRSSVVINGMLAVAYSGKGQSDTAQRYVREMLQKGQKARLFRSIVDLGGDLVALLNAYCRELAANETVTEGRLEYVKSLLEIARGASGEAHQPGLARPALSPGGSRLAEGVYGRLTAREQEILELVATGLKNREVARELLIAESSVRWHVRNIFSKLDVQNRTEAGVKARALKIIF